ncbi:MAG: glycosyltransferase [Acidovorax sp.]|nr:glycosyltransferase [Acidovorax sp.]
MGRFRIALVVPALNEAATIAQVAAAAGAHASVVVVDDGSTDDTPALAREAGAIVVSHGTNRGYDAALNTGFAEAARRGFEAVITLDADGQHDPSLVAQFIAALQGGADVVLGVRDERPRIAEHLFALYTRSLFGISDPLCGLKGYRIGVYESLGHFDSYGSIGTELMLFAARRGLRIEQVPFKVGARMDDPRFGRLFSANRRILRALFLSWGRA